MGTFFAAFSYNETCPPPLGPPLPIVPPIGTATGIATISGLTAVHSDVPTVLGATVRTSFLWIRYGAIAEVVTSNTRIDFSNGHFAVSASPVSGIVDGVAWGTFMPLPPPLGSGLGNCLSPVPTDAAIVMVGVVPA